MKSMIRFASPLLAIYACTALGAPNATAPGKSPTPSERPKTAPPATPTAPAVTIPQQNGLSQQPPLMPTAVIAPTKPINIEIPPPYDFEYKHSMPLVTKVTDKQGRAMAGVKVRFTFLNKMVNATTGDNGYALVSNYIDTLEPGSYPIEAEAISSPEAPIVPAKATGTIVMHKAATVFTLGVKAYDPVTNGYKDSTTEVNSESGKTIVIHGHLRTKNGNEAIVGRKVTVWSDTRKIASVATDENGAFKYTYKPTEQGVFDVTATFDGDTHYEIRTSGRVEVKVAKVAELKTVCLTPAPGSEADPMTVGRPVQAITQVCKAKDDHCVLYMNGDNTYTATNGVSGVKVTFSSGQSAVTNADGVAKITYVPRKIFDIPRATITDKEVADVTPYGQFSAAPTLSGYHCGGSVHNFLKKGKLSLTLSGIPAQAHIGDTLYLDYKLVDVGQNKQPYAIYPIELNGKQIFFDGPKIKLPIDTSFPLGKTTLHFVVNSDDYQPAHFDHKIEILPVDN